MAKKLADYYKQKGVVLRLVDKYRAEVEMSQSGDVLQVRFGLRAGGGGEAGVLQVHWRGGWAGRRHPAPPPLHPLL